MNARAIVDSVANDRRLKSSAMRDLGPLVPKSRLTEAESLRTVDTGLTGPVNYEILSSVLGQLSDGKWENVPSMAKYWRNATLREENGKIFVVVNDIDWKSPSGSGFRGKDDAWIKNFFAGKIKELVYDEKGGERWDRKDTTTLDYLGSSATPVTVSNAYKAYEILKGRSLKNKYGDETPPQDQPQG
jgi:hypothetical protein